MKKLAQVIVLLGSLLVLGLAVSRTSAPEGVLATQEASVTLGEFDDRGVFRRYCSGALVDGLVVTAGHCVNDNPVVKVQMFDGYIYQGRVLESVYAWPVSDYALVRLEIAPGLYPSLKRGDGLNLGQDLWAFSGPWGLGQLLLHGTYAGRLARDVSVPNSARGFHYSTMNAAGGSSGSVIVNDAGEAVAILVGAFGEDNRSLRLTGSLLVELP